jgi:endonuclease G
VIVKHLAAERLADPKKQEILDGLLALTTDPIDDLAKSAGTGFNPVRNENLPIARPGGQTMGGHQFNFSGPVTIHVYSPPSVSQVVPAALPAPRAAIELEKVIQFDQDYKGREGYDEKFLDPEKGRIVVPVPTVRQARANEILTDSGGKQLVLKYHHFSLAMNKRHRLQMWSAANVDYDPSKKTSRERKELGTDKWIPDPRIPTEAQLVAKDFYKPAGKIDRGHIVRREDNAWGDSERDIEFANSDTFHWTNCTPQHGAFNRSSPAREYGGISGLWGSFENHIQEGLNDVDTKACILAGPVLSEEDPSADFGGANPIKYPILFWKIVAVTVTPSQGAPDLRVFGFLLSQKAIVDRFGIEKFGPGRFKRYQVRLKDIEDAAGLEFAPALQAADTMRNQPNPVEIRNNNEIRGL